MSMSVSLLPLHFIRSPIVSICLPNTVYSPLQPIIALQKLIIMKKIWIRKAPIALLIGTGVFAAASGVTKWLWNSAIVPATHANPVDFWQAAGILALSKLLFGGFRGRGPMRRVWQQRMMARWEKMTPEQKEQFKSRMQGCRGKWKMQDEVAVG
jgi:Ca2+/H+ antiporter, TMEM165/GDT1 family